MRQTQEKLEQFVIDVILDRRNGVRASVLRVFLVLISKAYGGRGQLAPLPLPQPRSP